MRLPRLAVHDIGKSCPHIYMLWAGVIYVASRSDGRKNISRGGRRWRLSQEAMNGSHGDRSSVRLCAAAFGVLKSNASSAGLRFIYGLSHSMSEAVRYRGSGSPGLWAPNPRSCATPLKESQGKRRTETRTNFRPRKGAAPLGYELGYITLMRTRPSPREPAEARPAQAL